MLKRKLITEFSDSDGKRRWKILLSERQLGDNKPFTLLRQMLEFWLETNSTKNFCRTYGYRDYHRISKRSYCTEQKFTSTCTLADRIFQVTANKCSTLCSKVRNRCGIRQAIYFRRTKTNWKIDIACRETFPKKKRSRSLSRVEASYPEANMWIEAEI